MDLSILTNYVNVTVLIICLVVGYVLKNYVTVLANNYIPCIVTVLGVLLAVWVNGTVTPEVISVGLVSGLASTGMHQLVTQLLNKMGDSTETVSTIIESATETASDTSEATDNTADTTVATDDTSDDDNAVG